MEVILKRNLYTAKRYALQIQVYYDDFETANPLGSKRGIHCCCKKLVAQI